MSSVFFNTSTQLADEIKRLMAEEGYTNKAEFFRFLVKFFKYNRNHSLADFHRAVDDLEQTITALDKKGLLNNLPSPEKQLADV